MRFPLIEQLDLPCVFAGVVPGQLHQDGRRYLPLLLLRPTGWAGAGELLLGVVDRHHRVAEGEVGKAGRARLVCALSRVRVQEAPPRLGLVPENGARGGVSTRPTIYGRVHEVATWELGGAELPYQSLYTELSLAIGLGTIGLRTSLTAPRLADALGKERLEPGDYVELTRSRIDMLAFEPD